MTLFVAYHPVSGDALAFLDGTPVPPEKLLKCKGCTVVFMRTPGRGRPPLFHSNTCRTRYWKSTHPLGASSD